MARIVNEAVHAQKRNAILDATQRAIETKGYEQMAIADILNELKMSSGAFYHYFDSKPALLEALVNRIWERISELVLPIIQDQESGAIDKLQRFFVVLDQEKLTNKRFILAYLRVWYSDQNAIVRHKLYMGRIKRFTPWLEEIIRQGVEEGVFTAPYPDQTARIILSLFEDFAYATAEPMLSTEHPLEDLSRIERIAVAMADALERVLGAEPGSLQQTWSERLEQWQTPPSQANG